MSNWNSVTVAAANTPSSWDLMYFFPQMQSSLSTSKPSNAFNYQLPASGETSILPPLPLALKPMKYALVDTSLDEVNAQLALDYRQNRAAILEQLQHSIANKKTDIRGEEEGEIEEEEDNSWRRVSSMVNHCHAATDDDATTPIVSRTNHEEPTNGFAAFVGRRKQSKPLRVDKLAEDLLASKAQQNQTAHYHEDKTVNVESAIVSTAKRPDMTSSSMATTTSVASNELASMLPTMFQNGSSVNSLNQFANLMFFNPYAAAAAVAAASTVSSCMSSSPSCVSTSSAFMSMTPAGVGAGCYSNGNNHHMFLTPNLSGGSVVSLSAVEQQMATKIAMLNGSNSAVSMGGNEAYCDICQKSVCNKYFLKQHMINQHGIRDQNPPSNGCVMSQASHQAKVGPIDCSSANQSLVGSNKADEAPVNLCTKDNGLNLIINKQPLNKAALLPYVNELDQVFNFNMSSPPPGHPLDIQRRVEDIRLLNMMQQATSTPRHIDAESFCVLCNKEFANKYTLKMHRANMHPEQCVASSKCVNTSTIASDSIGSSSSVSAATPPTDTNNSTDNLVAMDNFQSSMLAAKLADRVTCDVCNKELCNKYFLKTHKQKVHGLMVDLMVTSPSSIGSNSSHFQDSDNTCHSGITNACTSTPYNHAAPLDMVVHSSAHKSSTHVVSSSSVSWSKEASHVGSQRDENGNSASGIDTEAYCHLCKKEFCSKYFLRTHRANIHGIVEEDNNVSNNNSISEHQPFASPLSMSTLSCKSTGLNTHAPHSKSNDVTGSVLMPSVRWPTRNSLQQQRVRCNVCGKEVCNKYFLRNHKLKKHGIPLDASAIPAARPPQQNMLSTTSVSSRLQAQSTPAPSAMEATVYQDVISESRNDMPACPLCDLLCPDDNHLELHMRTEHAEVCAATRMAHVSFNHSRSSSSFFEENLPLNLSVGDILKRNSRSPTTAPFTEPDQPEGAEEHHSPPAKQLCRRFPILTV